MGFFGSKKKKTGLDTDFSITDAVKRAKTRKARLKAMLEETNRIDAVSEELEQGNESDEIRSIFED